jgi:ABC-type uncharacterized transport system permease subunit
MLAKRLKPMLQELLIPVLAVILAMVLASGLVVMAGGSPLRTYRALISGAFGTARNLMTTLQWATPLILTGLAAMVAVGSGIFNVGLEGQMILGGLAAAYIGYAVELPTVVHISAALVAAMVVGAVWAYIPGLLKVKWNVNEIVITIVMNFIAALLFDWLLDTYMRTPSAQGRSYSPIVLPSATLMPFVKGTRFGPGFVIAVVAAILVYIYVFQTTRGYEQRMTGAASLFAKYGGIRIDRAALRGMLISGALCGLAGAIEVLGVHRRVMGGFSTGLGFDGLMVSILGGMHPFGVALGAIFIAGLRQGALTLEWASRIPRQLGGGIIALIILLMAAKSMLLNWMERAAKRIGRAPAREEGI